MIRSTLLPIAVGLFLFACQSGEVPANNEADAAASEAKLSAKKQAIIASLEDSLYTEEMKYERRPAKQIFDLYLAYAAEHPLDTITPEYIFRAAQVATGLGNNEFSIKLYDRVIKEYPGWKKVPEAKFMKGFTYENHMDQQGAAIDAYEVLIYDHPNHVLTPQARQLIENMQYTDEELIKKWKEENEKASS